MCSVSFQPGLPSASAAARASASTLSGTPDSSSRIGDVERPRVGGIEQVVVEPRGEHRELFVHGLEAGLFRRGQLRAAQPEIAQLVRHGAALRRVERGERRRRGELAIAREETQSCARSVKNAVTLGKAA